MDKQSRILIADDEVTFLEATAELLRNRGFICDCATDSNSAREFLEKEKYDLLISDINMPGNRYLEFIREQSEADEILPVILVTGYPSLESAANASDLNVINYLLKPVDIEDLLHWINFGLNLSKKISLIKKSENSDQLH